MTVDSLLGLKIIRSLQSSGPKRFNHHSLRQWHKQFAIAKSTELVHPSNCRTFLGQLSYHETFNCNRSHK
jgi:hypothetical protein